jgi:hypothetical protein
MSSLALYSNFKLFSHCMHNININIKIFSIGLDQKIKLFRPHHTTLFRLEQLINFLLLILVPVCFKCQMNALTILAFVHVYRICTQIRTQYVQCVRENCFFKYIYLYHKQIQSCDYSSRSVKFFVFL